MFLLQIGTYQSTPRVKKRMQFLHGLKLVQEALVKLDGQPKEHPVGLDDQLVEGRAGLKSELETRLYELDDSRLL